MLEEIVRYKKKEVEDRCSGYPLKELRSKIKDLPWTLGFKNTLSIAPTKLKLIAEIKKASPSKGVLKADLDPRALALTYEDNGASAISVLTDEHFFQGGLDNLTRIKEKVQLPLLEKDFILNEYQIYEARVFGADAILLIAAILEKSQLADYKALAGELGMDALMEVHNEKEIEKVSDFAEIVGINNRDLATFKTDIETTFKLIKYIPKGKILVSESGIESRKEVLELQSAGVNAILVGEALIKSDNPADKIRELMGAWVKVCGITNSDDAQVAVEAGADAIGFVFYDKSPRYIKPSAAREIISSLPRQVKAVGVFVDENENIIRQIAEESGIRLFQFHGNEPPQLVGKFNAIKAIRVKEKGELKRMQDYKAGAFLLDAFSETLYGGTGATFDWEIAKEAAKSGRVIIAGGLTPENVADAIKMAKPYGVDVSSGVESSPGKKDHNKVRKFIEKAKSI